MLPGVISEVQVESIDCQLTTPDLKTLVVVFGFETKFILSKDLGALAD
jgi:hypothetical protein